MLQRPMTIFAHAVASFDPTAEAVLLWTRLTGGTSSSWEVAPDPDFATVVARGTEETGPERDFTIVADATGLQPGTTYWYRFTCSGEVSPVGRTRTLPAGSVGKFRIGLVSCARYSVAPLTVYRALAETEVDLVVHLGDYIYDDSGERSPRRHDPRKVTRSLEDYRTRIAQVRADADCRALHLRHPMAFVWDDHDFADNAWLGGAKSHDPEEDGPWPARRDAAARAHREWVPWRRDPAWETLRIYRSLPVGDLAELILVDSRVIGRERQASEPGGKPVDDPTRSLLGENQWRWLEERLTDTAGKWAVVGGGVVFNPIPLWVPAAKLFKPLLPGGYVAQGGSLVLRDDQWDGYPAEREKLLELLGRRGPESGTVLVSADVHSSWAFEGPAGPDGAARAVEVTVPSVSSTPLGRSRPPGLWGVVDRTVSRMESVRWVDVTSHGFTTLELTPADATAAWWFVDPFDERAIPQRELGAAFRSRRRSSPPEWEPADRADLPRVNPGPELPPRPDDIDRMRRWHKLRQARAVVAVAGGGSVLASAAGWLVRRRR